MNSATLERPSVLRLAVAAAGAATLAALLLGPAGAEAAPQRPFTESGVVHVCFKVRGKARGAMRIVPHPRRCKRMRGWRRTAWTALGFPGPNGAPGLPGQRGATGEEGPEGDRGPQGAAGAIEESLIETIDNQAAEIATLTSQVTSLSSEVTSLGGEVDALGETVESACTQVSLLTDQSDELLGGIEGLSISGVVGALLEIPPLPATLGEFECA